MLSHEKPIDHRHRLPEKGLATLFRTFQQIKRSRILIIFICHKLITGTHELLIFGWTNAEFAKNGTRV